MQIFNIEDRQAPPRHKHDQGQDAEISTQLQDKRACLWLLDGFSAQRLGSTRLDWQTQRASPGYIPTASKP